MDEREKNAFTELIISYERHRVGSERACHSRASIFLSEDKSFCLRLFSPVTLFTPLFFRLSVTPPETLAV